MPPTDSLSGRLADHARADAERCAVAAPGISLSYGELDARVSERAAALGAGPGDVVGIERVPEVEHLIATLALERAGATSFALPGHGSAEERERALDRVGATAVLGEDGSLAPVDSPGTAWDEPRFAAATGPKLLFSTSGTTGEPKVVVHSGENLVLQARRHVSGPSERFACLAAMEHNFARRHRLYCVAMGGTNVFPETSPAALVQSLLSLDASTLHVSAFQAQELLALPGLDGLRGIKLKLGGSHVPEALRARLREEITTDVHCGYGTTETGAIGFTDPADEGSAESVGRALDGLEIAILDADRAPLHADERGEVAIRCDGMFLGYLGRSELTDARLVSGWFHTGDVGRLDAEGRLRLGGRGDDMFVFNSMNIHPQDLEAELRQHPGVLDAVVVPKPSPVHGDVPVALVVLGGEQAPDARALKAFARERLGLRSPRRFQTVDAIPRNAAGKIDRAEARALAGVTEAH